MTSAGVRGPRRPLQPLLLLVVLLVLQLAFGVAGAGPAVFNSESWVDVTEDEKDVYSSVPASEHWQYEGTEIFVGISSYRDKRCGLTLSNLFKSAKHPDRLRIGVVQQIHTEDDHFDCIKDYCALNGARGPSYAQRCPHYNQIKTIVFTYLDSRGPMFARYQQQAMIENEEFCLQLDSHTEAVPHWDELLMQSWGSIGNEYAVLSTRPPDTGSLNPDADTVPHLCHGAFVDSGAVRSLQPRKARDLSKPMLTSYWAGQFSFSKCHMEKKVPYDPYLQYLYDGEEMTRFARMWTRGYDVYTPNKVIFAHDYGDKMSAKLPKDFGATIKMETQEPYVPDKMKWLSSGPTPAFRRRMFDDSVGRMRLLMGMVKNPTADTISLLTKYGLGHKRTLDQLIEFTGIDYRSQQIFGDRCKKLGWVPFTPDSDPNVEDGDVWGFGPETLPQGHASIPLKSGNHRIIEVPSPLAPAAAAGSTNEVQADTKDNNFDNQNMNNNNNGNINKIQTISNEDIGEKMPKGDYFVVSLGPIDWLIDSAVNKIDSSLAQKTGVHRAVGHKMMKVILLGLPLFLTVVIAAAYTLNSGQDSVLPMRPSKRT